MRRRHGGGAVHAQREGSVRTQRGDSRLQGKERGVWRNQPCPHPAPPCQSGARCQGSPRTTGATHSPGYMQGMGKCLSTKCVVTNGFSAGQLHCKPPIGAPAGFTWTVHRQENILETGFVWFGLLLKRRHGVLERILEIPGSPRSSQAKLWPGDSERVT